MKHTFVFIVTLMSFQQAHSYGCATLARDLIAATFSTEEDTSFNDKIPEIVLKSKFRFKNRNRQNVHGRFLKQKRGWILKLSGPKNEDSRTIVRKYQLAHRGQKKCGLVVFQLFYQNQTSQTAKSTLKKRNCDSILRQTEDSEVKKVCSQVASFFHGYVKRSVAGAPEVN